jgi:hypothetical protein
LNFKKEILAIRKKSHLLNPHLFLIVILSFTAYCNLSVGKEKTMKEKEHEIPNGNFEKEGKKMKKIQMGRVFLAAFVASLGFIFAEIVLEGSVQLIFGINESMLFRELFGMTPPSGTIYSIMNIVFLYLLCVLTMWVYAAIRPRFRNHFQAALVASMIFWLFEFLLWVNISNLGLFPLKLGLLSMAFTLVEIPTAIIIGSFVYKE